MDLNLAVCSVFCWKSGMDPSSVIFEYFWLGTVIVMCLDHHMEV